MIFIEMVLDKFKTDGTINFEIRQYANVIVLHYRNKICNQRLFYEKIYSMSTFQTIELCQPLADDFHSEVMNYINNTLN